MDQFEALHNEILTKSPETRTAALKSLQGAVAPYDSGLLAAALAGLTLLPQNASFQLRLESMIDAVSSQDEDGRAIPTTHRIQSLCEGTLARDLVSPLEDPAEYPVTEPLGFEDHVYTVFTGQGEEVVFVCERLFEAFADLAKAKGLAELDEAVSLIRVCLALDERIAVRAGVGAGLGPQEEGQVHVPRLSARQLGEPVRWTDQAIEEVCEASQSSIGALTPLTATLGEVPARALSDSEHVTFVPLLHGDDGFWIVRAGQLLPALGSHLQTVAAHVGLLAELADRFAARTNHSVLESAVRLGAEPLPVRLGSPGIPSLFERCYRADAESALITITLGNVPDLELPEPEPFPSPAISAVLEQRVRDLAGALRSAGPYADILVCVVPAVLPGHGYALHEVATEEVAESIALTAPSLEVIAFHEHNPLALHRYARSVRELHEKTHVLSFNPLDLFALYRDRDHSFYLDDARLYTGVSVTPGYGLSLRLEMLNKQQRQSAPGPHGEREIDVVRGSLEGLPIFRPREIFDQPLRLVRLRGGDFWVVCPPWPNLPKELAGFNEQLANAVAYWVWRAASAIFVADRSGQRPTATVFVELDKIGEWGGPELPVSQQNRDITYSLDRSGDALELLIQATWQGALAQPDNFAERHLVWLMIEGLIELLDPGQQSTGRVEEILNEVAPIGPRRMLMAMESDTTSLLGPDGALPAWRAVSDWERGRVRDELAAAYRAEGYAPGPPGEANAQNELIRFAVSFFLAALIEHIAQLSPEGLIEDLLRREESLIRAVGQAELTIPTRLACFGDVMDVASAITTETKETTQASIAHRFLIEYVTARPPNGKLALTNVRYDRLLALAASIAEYGFNSDVTHYRLDDLRARILPSGRLGIARGRYEAATERWTRGMSRRQIEWSQDKFPSHWAEPADSPGPPSEWQEAFRAEFGFSVTELREVLDELLDLAGDSPDAVARWSREMLIAELEARTKRPAPELVQILAALTLGPRADFERPEGFAKEDVYPWRFNRRLSLLRRPLIARGDELLWGRRGVVISVRHLLMSIETGRLRAQSRQMRDLLSKTAQRQGSEFEEEVAAQVRALGFDLRRRVKKLGKQRLAEAGEDLGDIDVLAIDPASKRLWAIECKSLAFSRTPWELASQADAFADPEVGIPARHRRRIDWLRSHQAELAAFIGQRDLRGWQIEPVIVVEVDLLALHLHAIEMTVTDPAGLEAVLRLSSQGRRRVRDG
jgi:hypothetical protein